MHSENKEALRKKEKRALRVRAKLHGTAERPRLCFVRSNTAIYAQLINDVEGKTILGFSSKPKGAVKAVNVNSANKKTGAKKTHKNKESAELLGQKVAESAKKHNIKAVVFDRGSARYHGVIQAFADAARTNGLQF